MRIAHRTFQRAAALNAVEWLILARAAAALTVASAAVAMAPFRRAISFGNVGLRRPSKMIVVRDVVWAIGAWSRRMPWRTKCIEQGIAAQRLLRLGGVDARLHYGVRQVADRLEAHVWVTVDGRPVIGGGDASGFAEVASYPTI
jgi:hypothetical protein